MKIIVDNMPSTVDRCPYCKDESTMDYDKYTCTWNNCNRNCYDTNDCPFFKAERNEADKEMDDEISN